MTELGEELLAFLNDKWAKRPCPMCGKREFNVQEKIFQLMQFNKGSLVVGGPVIPVIPVVCINCGNTILVNAIIANVLPRPEAKAKEVP